MEKSNKILFESVLDILFSIVNEPVYNISYIAFKISFILYKISNIGYKMSYHKIIYDILHHISDFF